jgi:hypothetical protein
MSECDDIELRFTGVRIAPIACLLIACGTPAPVARIAPSVLDAGPDAAIDAPPDAIGLHVGAVPVPGEYVEEPLSENLVDKSVSMKDLPPINSKWKSKRLLSYRGQVAIALSEWQHTELALSVVDTVTKTETGYPGTLWTFKFGPAEPPARDSANAYPPRDVNASGVYMGPVMFAVRVLPKKGAPESERRQVVVYTSRQSVLVAEKRVDDKTWTPRLRIDLPAATAFIAMDPGWH